MNVKYSIVLDPVPFCIHFTCLYMYVYVCYIVNPSTRVSVHNAVEVCRYTFILLIIPLRITDSDWQWKVASLAIILNGLRLLHYATVLPYVHFVLTFYVH